MQVDYKPFPHFVRDRVFDKEALSAIEEFWPADAYFELEGHSQHSRRCHLVRNDFSKDGCHTDRDRSTLFRLPEGQRKAWEALVMGPIHRVALSVLDAFAPFFARTRGGLARDLYFDRIWLDSAPANYHQHGLRVHTHYDHDPLWVFTGVIYLDDANGDVPGTYLATNPALEGRDGDAAIADTVLNSRRWYQDPDFHVEKSVPIAKNRMLAMADGPASFHGVSSFAQGDSGLAYSRRTLLFHLCLHPRHCPAVCGTTREAFWTQAQKGVCGPEIRLPVIADTKQYLQVSRALDGGLDASADDPSFVLHPPLMPQ